MNTREDQKMEFDFKKRLELLIQKSKQQKYFNILIINNTNKPTDNLLIETVKINSTRKNKKKRIENEDHFCICETLSDCKTRIFTFNNKKANKGEKYGF